MTFDEFKALAKGMKSVYTSERFLPDADSIKIWYQMLQDLEYQSASAAIQKYMLTNKYPPTIADIREAAASVQHGDVPDWSDAWEVVLRCISKYGSYRESDALASMDEMTRTAVKRLGFRNICMSENITADRANFRMIYEQLAQRKQKEQQISLPLKELIQGIQQQGMLQIEGK